MARGGRQAADSILYGIAERSKPTGGYYSSEQLLTAFEDSASSGKVSLEYGMFNVRPEAVMMARLLGSYPELDAAFYPYGLPEKLRRMQALKINISFDWTLIRESNPGMYMDERHHFCEQMACKYLDKLNFPWIGIRNRAGALVGLDKVLTESNALINIDFLALPAEEDLEAWGIDRIRS